MINTSDVDKFNKLSSEWWDRNGPLKTLHHINDARLNFIKDHADLNNHTILDVGCGGGILTESLYEKSRKVTGIDLAPDSIEVAQGHADKHNLPISYHCISIEDYAHKAEEQFDVVCCLELLEHLEDPELFLQSLIKTVKPSGKLFLSTVNRNMKSYAQAILAAEYVLNLLPKGTHDYKQFITPSELIRSMSKLGYECLGMKGIKYDPFFHTAKIIDDLSVNYIAVFSQQ